jgi:hypothetical protein
MMAYVSAMSRVAALVVWFETQRCADEVLRLAWLGIVISVYAEEQWRVGTTRALPIVETSVERAERVLCEGVVHPVESIPKHLCVRARRHAARGPPELSSRRCVDEEGPLVRRGEKRC